MVGPPCTASPASEHTELFVRQYMVDPNERASKSGGVTKAVAITSTSLHKSIVISLRHNLSAHQGRNRRIEIARDNRRRAINRQQISQSVGLTHALRYVF